MVTQFSKVKILFNLDPSEWHGCAGETLWAEPVHGLSDGIFRIANSPFYYCGVSFQDEVRANLREEGIWEYVETIKEGGHSTYMIIFQESELASQYWKQLEDLGCSYESAGLITSRADNVIYSIDVPGHASIYEVYALLELGEIEKAWTFQEGHVGHALTGSRMSDDDKNVKKIQ